MIRIKKETRLSSISQAPMLLHWYHIMYIREAKEKTHMFWSKTQSEMKKTN